MKPNPSHHGIVSGISSLLAVGFGWSEGKRSLAAGLAVRARPVPNERLCHRRYHFGSRLYCMIAKMQCVQVQLASITARAGFIPYRIMLQVFDFTTFRASYTGHMAIQIVSRCMFLLEMSPFPWNLHLRLNSSRYGMPRTLNARPLARLWCP